MHHYDQTDYYILDEVPQRKLLEQVFNMPDFIPVANRQCQAEK